MSFPSAENCGPPMSHPFRRDVRRVAREVGERHEHPRRELLRDPGRERAQVGERDRAGHVRVAEVRAVGREGGMRPRPDDHVGRRGHVI